MKVGEIALPGERPMLIFAKLEAAVPMPLRLITAGESLEELLAIVS
jgi:hypothetical protein